MNAQFKNWTRPIRTRAVHKSVLDEMMRIGRMMDAGKATKTQCEAAEVLKILTGDYERSRFSRVPNASTPLERLRYLVDESGITPSDLGRLLGDRALGCRILSGERELIKAHIRKLADHFRLEPGYFI